MNTAKSISTISALVVALALPVGAAGDLIYTDAEILGIVGAANQGELEAAALASNKATNGDVKTFAQRMTKDHSDAKRKIDEVASKAGLSPTDTDLSGSLTKSASDEAARLGILNGTAFDGAYIDAQVADHQKLLQEIDKDLTPDAKNESVRALLRELRPTVAHHLAMARRLQSGQGRTGK